MSMGYDCIGKYRPPSGGIKLAQWARWQWTVSFATVDLHPVAAEIRILRSLIALLSSSSMLSEASHSSGMYLDGTDNDYRSHDMETTLQFPSPFEFHEFLPATSIELRMRQFSGKIRQRANWWEEINDSEVVSKWRREMIERDRVLVAQHCAEEERYHPGNGEKTWPRDEITSAQLNYIFDELKYDAHQLQQGLAFYVSVARALISRATLILVFPIAFSSVHGVRIQIFDTTRSQGETASRGRESRACTRR